MKRYSAVVALVLMATFTMSAQDNKVRYFTSVDGYRDINSAKVERQYLVSLSTGNDGVLESALAHVAMMKLALPNERYQVLHERVTDIAKTASSPEIRYKAFLTAMTLDDPKIFGAMDLQQFKSPDELFAALASRLGQLYAVK
jgi:hypothetical protein